MGSTQKLGSFLRQVANTLAYYTEELITTVKSSFYRPKVCLASISIIYSNFLNYVNHILTNEPNKLEYYITLGWKDLQVTNTLA
jgi:hypothetical protein